MIWFKIRSKNCTERLSASPQKLQYRNHGNHNSLQSVPDRDPADRFLLKRVEAVTELGRFIFGPSAAILRGGAREINEKSHKTAQANLRAIAMPAPFLC